MRSPTFACEFRSVFAFRLIRMTENVPNDCVALRMQAFESRPLENRPALVPRIPLESSVWRSVAVNLAVRMPHDDTAIFARRHGVRSVAAGPARPRMGSGKRASEHRNKSPNRKAKKQP